MGKTKAVKKTKELSVAIAESSTTAAKDDAVITGHGQGQEQQQTPRKRGRPRKYFVKEEEEEEDGDVIEAGAGEVLKKGKTTGEKDEGKSGDASSSIKEEEVVNKQQQQQPRSRGRRKGKPRKSKV